MSRKKGNAGQLWGHKVALEKVPATRRALCAKPGETVNGATNHSFHYVHGEVEVQ